LFRGHILDKNAIPTDYIGFNAQATDVTMDDRDSAVDEPTSPVHPIASSPPIFANLDPSRPVKGASGRRAAEFYGFVAWLLTLLVYITYLLWTILPDESIRAMDIDWYPARQVSSLEAGGR
jgi:hypothetical protein